MIQSFNANNKRNLSSTSSSNSSDIQQASKKANNEQSLHSNMSSATEYSGTGSYPAALLAQLGLIQRPPSKADFPSSPAYGVFISQLICYARASTKYTDFILRARRLSDKLLSQGYVCDRLTSSLRKFYGRHGELVIHYDVPLSRMVDDIMS